jgi:hypothetical protein
MYISVNFIAESHLVIVILILHEVEEGRLCRKCAAVNIMQGSIAEVLKLDRLGFKW